MRISLTGTELERPLFDDVRLERSETDWLEARIDNGTWDAACGPLNLVEAAETFLAWAAA